MHDETTAPLNDARNVRELTQCSYQAKPGSAGGSPAYTPHLNGSAKKFRSLSGEPPALLVQ